MIGHRYAAAGRIAQPAPTHEHKIMPPGGPIPAGREYLAGLLHGSFLLQLMLAMMLVAASLIIYLAQASQMSILEFRIQDLQQQQMRLQTQNASLTAQAAGLQSPQRIDWLAAHKLGMVKPDTAPVWLAPQVPTFPATAPPDLSVQKAQQVSRPFAWMQDFLGSMWSSL